MWSNTSQVGLVQTIWRLQHKPHQFIVQSGGYINEQRRDLQLGTGDATCWMSPELLGGASTCWGDEASLEHRATTDQFNHSRTSAWWWRCAQTLSLIPQMVSPNCFHVMRCWYCDWLIDYKQIHRLGRRGTDVTGSHGSNNGLQFYSVYFYNANSQQMSAQGILQEKLFQSTYTNVPISQGIPVKMMRSTVSKQNWDLIKPEHTHLCPCICYLKAGLL